MYFVGSAVGSNVVGSPVGDVGASDGVSVGSNVVTSGVGSIVSKGTMVGAAVVIAAMGGNCTAISNPFFSNSSWKKPVSTVDATLVPNFSKSALE